MIIDLGTRGISVANDEPSANFTAAITHEVRLAPTRAGSEQIRAVVELRRFHGGLAPHVLLGAGYEPGGEVLVLRISEGTPSRMKRSCKVQLGGRKLVPGLPSELVEPAISGLARTLDIAPGVVTLDRAGFDPVETSPIIVELAAEILGRLLSLPMGQQLTDVQLREWLLVLP